MKPGEPMAIIAIYLRGERLRPDNISHLLGLQSSRSQERGGFCSGSKTAVAKIGVWTLIAQAESRSIVDHVDELLKKVGSPTTPLDQIDGVDEAYLDIFITPDYEHREREPVEGMLTREHLTALDRLGLCLQFTVS